MTLCPSPPARPPGRQAGRQAGVMKTDTKSRASSCISIYSQKLDNASHPHKYCGVCSSVCDLIQARGGRDFSFPQLLTTFFYKYPEILGKRTFSARPIQVFLDYPNFLTRSMKGFFLLGILLLLRVFRQTDGILHPAYPNHRTSRYYIRE